MNWIPGQQRGPAAGQAGRRTAPELRRREFELALISYLYADDVYRARYVEFVEAVIDDVFNPARMTPIYQAAATWFSPTSSGATAR